MKIFAAATLISAIAPLISGSPLAAANSAATQSTTLTTDQSLADWWQAAPFGLFPNHTGWEASFDALVSPDVKASFNFVTYDFAGLKKFFTGVYGAVSTKYEYLHITPVDSVVLSNPGDKGGLVYMTGREVGLLKTAGSQERVERDAVFAIVKEINGTRMFVEWRETTNFF